MRRILYRVTPAVLSAVALAVGFGCPSATAAAPPEPKAVAVALALAADPADRPEPIPAPVPVAKTRQVAAALALACPCGPDGCPPDAETSKRLAALEAKVADILQRFSEPVPQPMPAAKATTDGERYAALMAAVEAGSPAVLFVGVPVNGEFVHKVGVSAEFKGIRSGVYDCFLHTDGTPSLRNRDGGPTFGPPPVAASPRAFRFNTFGEPLDQPVFGCPNGRCPQR